MISSKLGEQSLLNGLLVAYPQDPLEGDLEEFRSHARNIIRRIADLWGYDNHIDMISDHAVKLFDEYESLPAKMAMIGVKTLKESKGV